VGWDIVAHFLGLDWARKHLNPVDGNAYFLMQVTDDDPVGPYLRQHRLIALGRRLFDLQNVPGFDDAVVSLRSRSLEGAVAELVAVTRLRDRGHLVRFVTPSGVKGQDFDAEVEVDGLTVAVEVKAKEELSGEVFRPKSIINSLKKASSQLPSSGPSLVFLHIPSEWAGDPKIRVSIDATVRTWLKSSGRVNAVVLTFDQQIAGETGGMAFFSGHDMIPNPAPRARVRNILGLLGGIPLTGSIHVNLGSAVVSGDSGP
jgi:hypothetical protein